MTSDYWTEIDPDGYEIKVRKCKNGCETVVYWDDQVGDRGRFVEFSNNEIHDCPNFKKSSTSHSSPRPQQSKQQQQQQPSRSSNNEDKIVQNLANIYEVQEASRQLLKQIVESQHYFEKLLEVRYKELRKDDPDSVPTEEQLAFSESSEQEAKEFRNDI